MREADKGYFRGMSIAGFFIIVSIMLVFAALLAPARRAWSNQPQKDIAMLDLELGDPERERKRDRGRGLVRALRREPKRDRGMPDPDEYDIFGNPWKIRSSECVTMPEPVHLPVSCGLSPSLDAGDIYPESQRGLVLPDPDTINIPAENEAVPIPEPPPVRPALISFRTLTSLGPRLLRWKAQAALADDDKDEDKGKAVDIEANPGAATEILPPPDLAALSAAAARAARTPPDEPFPKWLITPKASAGPRTPRFFEVGLEDAACCAPPDLDFVAMQHELLARVPISARPGMDRGRTWHPGHGPVEGEPARPAFARNQTAAD
ncbi:hypothetical protein UCDDA912_g00677 [Diaporthe ampelina]|uniref:Uncharacterized protein n=1 Tax=Diaporthe ampelina TaxID=1214573 RepID=A0A0G2FZP8_9PEZI|nr:hypothetical protein UCDDA912_g00677 [Diaporthe ampelina]